MTNRLFTANLIARVDAGMPASICSGRSASTRTGPAEMLADLGLRLIRGGSWPRHSLPPPPPTSPPPLVP